MINEISSFNGVRAGSRQSLGILECMKPRISEYVAHNIDAACNKIGYFPQIESL